MSVFEEYDVRKHPGIRIVCGLHVLLWLKDPYDKTKQTKQNDLLESHSKGGYLFKRWVLIQRVGSYSKGGQAAGITV